MERIIAKLRRFKIRARGGTPGTTPGLTEAPKLSNEARTDVLIPELTSRLEDLPGDLKRYVLFSLPNIDSLQALVHASPAFHQEYSRNRRTVLCHMLKAELGTNVFVDALAARRAMELKPRRRDYRFEVQEFLAWYCQQRLRSMPKPRDIPLNHAIGMARFYRIVRSLTTKYIIWAIDKDGLLGITVPPLSLTERVRIMRAIYRIQIACGLYGANHRRRWRVKKSNDYIFTNFDYHNIVRDFLSLFEPWEAEEIWCILQFLISNYQRLLRSIDSEVLPVNLKVTLDGFDIQSLPGGDRLSSLTFIEGTLSRGLELLHLAFAAEAHPDLIDLMVSYAVPADFNFLTDAFGDVPQIIRYEYDPTDHDKKQKNREPLLFRRDSEAGPPLAWVIAWRGTYSNVFGVFIPDELVNMGWVMWDASRLVKSGIKRKMLDILNTSKDWDHDPRLEFG